MILKYLLLTYEKEDIITEKYNERKSLKQGDRMYQPESSQELWKKELRCGTVSSKDHIKGILIKGIHVMIIKCIREYFTKNGESLFQALDRQAK